jgi:hypothetical protein
MTNIYVVWHLDQETMEDDDQEKLIGAYSTEECGKEAIARLRDKPGFRDFPERWHIDHIVLDKDSFWTDGFITVRPGDKPWEENP